MCFNKEFTPGFQGQMAEIHQRKRTLVGGSRGRGGHKVGGRKGWEGVACEGAAQAKEGGGGRA